MEQRSWKRGTGVGKQEGIISRTANRLFLDKNTHGFLLRLDKKLKMCDNIDNLEVEKR